MKKLFDLIEFNLKKNIEDNLPLHNITNVYKYALLPPGKLFRPLLVLNAALDTQNNISEDHLLLACFLEIHHAYTLIHDDLPCMDNDDFRRGKPSTHRAHGEWQALLAGDALLNLSYRMISKIKSQNLHELLDFITTSVGPKGLIHGQVLDLSTNKNITFNEIIKVHILKTSRLMQVAIEYCE